MKCALSLLFLIITSPCNCQETFFRFYPLPEDEGVYSLVEDYKGSYHLAGGLTKSSGAECGYIISVDKTGEVLSRFLSTTESYYSNIFLTADHCKFIVTGAENSTSTSGIFNRLSVWTYDTTFNLLSKGSCIFSEGCINLPEKALLINDSIVYILSSVFSEPNQPFHLSVLKFSLPIDSISFYTSPLSGGQSPNDLIIDPNNNTLIISYGGTAFDRGVSKVLKLDADLNYISVFEPNLNMLNIAGLCNYTDTTYLITSTAVSSIVSHQHLMTAEYDYNDNLLDIIEIAENPPDTLVYCGNPKNTLVKDSVIWTLGIYNTIPMEYPWQTQPSWIQVNRFNNTMQLLSQHYYGGDAYYSTSDIKATTDGGVIILGNRFDYNQYPYQNDPFLLKLNGDGVIVSAQNNELPSANECIIFPNPGGDYLKATLSFQHKFASFKLYNMSGTQCLHIEINNSTQEVQTGQLKSGTYLYVVESQGKTLATGKWIKK